MNSIVYDEKTTECEHGQCFAVKDMVQAIKTVGLENVPRLCPPTPKIVKGSLEDNGRWWTPEQDEVYYEQLQRYNLAKKRFGAEAVKQHEGGCLPIQVVLEDVANTASKAE
jgi:hypothetical protein